MELLTKPGKSAEKIRPLPPDSGPVDSVITMKNLRFRSEYGTVPVTYRIGITHGTIDNQADVTAMLMVSRAADPFCSAIYGTSETTTYCIADGGLKETLSAIARNKRKNWPVAVTYQGD